MDRKIIEDIKIEIRSQLKVKSLSRAFLFDNAGLSRPEEFDAALQEMLTNKEIRIQRADPTNWFSEDRYYYNE